jgi:4-alpha-glucanotransferase
MGPRTLGPGEPGYAGHYGGGLRERDAAYHQGTAWPWFLGPLVSAHLRVFGDAEAARALLAPMEHHLRTAGLGSISEIADGDPPHAPRGSPWQAWSVAEVLRAWRECSRFAQASADSRDPAVPSAEQPLVTASGETRA